MGININKKTEFGPEGFLIVRNNPDGTPPSPDRVLGFYGTVDLSDYAPSYDTWLGVKIDNGTEDYQEVDFSGAVDPTAVTVQEMVDAINAAGFTDITASVDTVTSRLLTVYTGAGTPTFLQVFSVDSSPNFAAELDFGQGQTFGGSGCIYYEAFDNTRTVALPKNIKDSEEIENESGDGTFISVIIPAIVKGYSPTLTCKDNDYQIKQLIQAGTWTPATSTYVPALSSLTRRPIFSIIFFSPVYNKGTHLREDEDGYLCRRINNITGYEADETFETKTLKETSYNCKAAEYDNELEVKQPYYTDQILSVDEFDALNVTEITPITDADT